MHPLAPDLASLSDEELHSKRAELQTRLDFAYRMGHGDMAGQIHLLIENYTMEIQIRNHRILDQAQKSGRLGSSDAMNVTKE